MTLPPPGLLWPIFQKPQLGERGVKNALNWGGVEVGHPDGIKVILTGVWVEVGHPDGIKVIFVMFLLPFSKIFRLQPNIINYFRWQNLVLLKVLFSVVWQNIVN